jgi:DNA-binding NarL/FixJ family response regulator
LLLAGSGFALERFSDPVNYTVLRYLLKENKIMARTVKSKTKSSLANLTPPPRKKRPESLTSREQEILELIWAGFKNKEIGQRLKISVKTVEAHRANMMKKMRVSNTAQLLKTAIQDGTIRVR